MGFPITALAVLAAVHRYFAARAPLSNVGAQWCLATEAWADRLGT